jgi:uncharacterized membrane protein
MNIRRYIKLLVWVGGLVALAVLPGPAVRADEPTVHAVLFFSPSCPHCHTVMSEDIPPLMAQYGEQLDVVNVNVMTPTGRQLYQAALEEFQIPSHRVGVPALIIDDVVLVGAGEIPTQFPNLIETYLEQGGVGLPAVPGLAEAVEASREQQRAAEAQPPDTAPAEATTVAGAPADDPLTIDDGQADGVGAKLARDPVGNTLALVVLVGMVAMVGYTSTALRRPASASAPGWHAWAIPLLCLVGAGVAGYLAFVETTQATAVCGPVGDCNTVQQSPYARLFGVLPVGVLGLVGYAAIALAWGVGRFGQRRAADVAWLALFVLALLGTLFSIYLTFLEPFVIGATCAWCLASAIIMTALLWLALPHGKQALARLRQSGVA